MKPFGDRSNGSHFKVVPAARHTPTEGGPGQALRALPAWLLSDIRDEHRSVCLDGCGVGDELPSLVHVFGSVPVWGIDASDEAIAEARLRFPGFRLKVAADNHNEQWDVVVRLEVPSARKKLLGLLEHLCAMSRQAVVLVAHPTVDLLELPLTIGRGFVLAGCTLTDDAHRWLVLTWVVSEHPQLKHLAVGAVFPTPTLGESAASQKPQMERLRTDLAQVRAHLIESQRDALASREMLAEKQAELEHLAREVDALRTRDAQLCQELLAMQTSRSWRLTRPFRTVVGGVRTARDQAKDLVQLAERVSRDVVQGRAKEWLRAPNERSPQERPIPKVVVAPAGKVKPLFTPTVYMFALVPFDDVGGGQRSAQLARVFAARGYQVVYVYLYKKWNVVLAAEEESEVHVPLLTHVNINEADPNSLLRTAAPGSVAVFEAPHPRYLPFLERARQMGLRTVFELIDAWDTSLGGDWYKPELMQRYATESEVVVGSARSLVADLERRGRADAVYLPNAGNESIFDGQKQFERPPEMDVSKRAFVYVGSLYGEWFGWDFVKAAARHCSDAIFYLIGDPPRGLELPGNVRLLGPKKIDEVVPYLAAADAALLPFIPGKISEAVSPIKIFEYLMMGKRVISTDLPEIRGYPNVTIAHSAEAFASACRGAAPPDVAPESFIMRNTWSARADRLLPSTVMSRLCVVVLGDGRHAEATRCVESLALHGAELVENVFYVAPSDEGGLLEKLALLWPRFRWFAGSSATIGTAWSVVKQHVSSETVLFIDERSWVTSRACFEEALRILETEASIGAVGARARFLDPETGRSEPVKTMWLNDQHDSVGYRREVGYLTSRELFVRTRLLERVCAAPFESGELEGAELSFRIRDNGLDLAARALTGMRAFHQGPPVISRESREAFLGRWRASRQFFVYRRGV